MASQHPINAIAMVNIIAEVANKMGKLYGLTYIKTAAKFAVKFEAKMIGDSNPPQVDTIRDCKEYVIRNLPRYPDGYASILYGALKAESATPGVMDSGTKVLVDLGAPEMRYVLYEPIDGTKPTNTVSAYLTLLERAEKSGALLGNHTVEGDENSVKVTYRECRLADACRALIREGVKRVDGSFDCMMARTGSSGLGNLTGLPHESEIIECNPPECTFRILKV
jgi:hypothetical protein